MYFNDLGISISQFKSLLSLSLVFIFVLFKTFLLPFICLELTDSMLSRRSTSDLNLEKIGSNVRVVRFDIPQLIIKLHSVYIIVGLKTKIQDPSIFSKQKNYSSTLSIAYKRDWETELYIYIFTISILSHSTWSDITQRFFVMFFQVCIDPEAITMSFK